MLDFSTFSTVQFVQQMKQLNIDEVEAMTDDLATSPETTRQNAHRDINQISPWKAITSKWQQVGHGIESTETQVAMLFVIYLDLVISCLLLALTSAEVGGGTCLIALFSNSLTVRVLHTVTSLTLLVTVGELAVLMLTFGIKMFLSHAGYALDSMIVSVFVCHEIHYVNGVSSWLEYF